MWRLVRILLPAILLGHASALFAAPDKVVTLPGDKPTGPHHVTSEVCKTCHEDIYNQWAGSMHANSTPLKDPIHGALYRNVMGDPLQEGLRSKKGAYPICLKCHVPAAAIDKKTKVDAMAAYEDGVSCVVCHLIKDYKGTHNDKGKLNLGIDAYELSTTHLQATSGHIYTMQPTDSAEPAPGKPVFHPFPMESNAAVLKSNQLCMGCHHRRDNAQGVALCVTGEEYEQSGSFVTCQSCHMPVVNGVTSHAMMGGHHEEMVRKGLVLTMDTRRDGDNIVADVNVHNQLPHAWPTGAPFRNMYIAVIAYDDQGKELWRNYKTHPLQDDPKSMFMYKLAGDDGKPAPPPKATKVAGDTRLMPNERRTISYTLPAAGVSVVRAEAHYNLLLPGMVKQMDKILTPDLKESKLAAMIEVKI